MNYPTPLTREQRDLIRQAIDAKRRDELAKHRARLEQGKADARRRTSWQRYYWRNRNEILARRADRRQAA